MPDGKQPPGSHDAQTRSRESPDDLFGHYWEYAKLWRTWVVGIAAAALFILLHKDVGLKFECRAAIAARFILAAGLQVLVALVNKTSAYYEYKCSKCRAKDKKPSKWARACAWCGDKYVSDLVFDAASFALVAWAVAIMLTHAFGGPHLLESVGPPSTQPS